MVGDIDALVWILRVPGDSAADGVRSGDNKKSGTFDLVDDFDAQLSREVSLSEA